MARSRNRFIDFVNDKYEIERKKHKRKRGVEETMFKHYDDYALFLFYGKFKMNDERYYEQLEEDIREYSNKQTKYKELQKNG